MPGLRLRKRLLDRLVKGASSASELGLALLMTAGVVRCGGGTTDNGEGTADAAADHGQGGGPVIEAPPPVIEAAAGGGPMVEAADFPDAGSDGHPSPIVEAPPPPREAGSDAHDAGSDGHISPMLEAPSFSDN